MTSTDSVRAPAQSSGLATASLVCGIASFVPLTPPLLTPLAALLLGYLSPRHQAPDRRLRRATNARVGMTLGAVHIAIGVVFCLVYFVVLGYPFPHLHRYHP